MLENNSTRLMFAAIAVVIGGVIYGSVNAAYPEATNQIIKKIQAPFDDSNNSDSNVNVAQYAQKTINVYVPYAIVPGKGILLSHSYRNTIYDDSNTYTMKDSSFIKNKYKVHDDDNTGIYSDYSLDGTNSYTDGNGKTISRVGFYDQPDIAPLLQNGKLSNIKMLKSADENNNGNYAFSNTPADATSMWVTNISNNTDRQGSIDLDKTIFDDNQIVSSDYDTSYTFGQDGVAEKTSEFVKNNNVLGSSPFGSWQVPVGAFLDGWSEDDYNSTTVPKDSSIDGFYILDSNYSHSQSFNNSELAPLIKKYNIPNDATLQYVGKLHINFHFVDVGYDTTTN